jgi:hypothetical protein
MTQLEAGISEAILEEPHIQISYITATWITSIRKFMAHHNIQMTVTDTLQVRFNSGNDTCIMDPVKLRGYSPQQQRDINLVRLYLRSYNTIRYVTTKGK